MQSKKITKKFGNTESIGAKSLGPTGTGEKQESSAKSQRCGAWEKKRVVLDGTRKKGAITSSINALKVREKKKNGSGTELLIITRGEKKRKEV